LNQKHIGLALALLAGDASVARAGVEKPWDASLAGGWSVAQSDIFGFAHSQTVFWSAVGYRVSPVVSFGMEGGHFFGSDTIDPVDAPFVDTQHVSATHVGPYIQGELPVFKRFTVLGRFGTGATTVSTHGTETNTTTGLDQYFDFHQTNISFTFMLGSRFWLAPNIALGLGLRDLLLFRYETGVSNAGAPDPNLESTLHGRNVLVPFGEVAFRF